LTQLQNVWVSKVVHFFLLLSSLRRRRKLYATQCSKDCDPYKCTRNCTRTSTCMRMRYSCQPKHKPQLLCLMFLPNFFLHFLHLKIQVYQWNMQKNMVLILLTMNATILDTHSIIMLGKWQGWQTIPVVNRSFIFCSIVIQTYMVCFFSQCIFATSF